MQLADIAAVPAGYVPLRAVVQADHGSASWYKDENQSFFYLNGVSIVTDFNDMRLKFMFVSPFSCSEITLFSAYHSLDEPGRKKFPKI